MTKQEIISISEANHSLFVQLLNLCDGYGSETENLYWMPNKYKNVVSYELEPVIFYVYGVMYNNDTFPTKVGCHYDFNTNPWNPGRPLIDSDYLQPGFAIKNASELCDYLGKLSSGIIVFSIKDKYHDDLDIYESSNLGINQELETEKNLISKKILLQRLHNLKNN